MRDRVLIANRGEIAVRVARGAVEAGMEPAVVYSTDDSASLHAISSELRYALPGTGPAAYLDAEQIIAAAAATESKYVHPGYGFLSENADFARACVAAGLIFVGPSPGVLDLFGNKPAALDFARAAGVPVLESRRVHGPDEVLDFIHELSGSPVLLKAAGGGGGRGIRVIADEQAAVPAFEQCRREAELAFGVGDLYVERYLPRVRHIEVQIVADGSGNVVHLWDRDCSVQRNNQKLLEVAPVPAVPTEIRTELWNHSTALAAQAEYVGVGTFEYLLWEAPHGSQRYAFIEANARLQVEHTITEELTGTDLVLAQLQIAAGFRLEDTNVWSASSAYPDGTAVQLRINAETLAADGSVRASSGQIRRYVMPAGPGVRIDGCGYPGYVTSARFDSLLAKVIIHTPRGRTDVAFEHARAALRETRIDGIETNVPLLWAILSHDGAQQTEYYTRFVDDHRRELIALSTRYTSVFSQSAGDTDATGPSSADIEIEHEDAPKLRWMRAPTHGAFARVGVRAGDVVVSGQELAVVEAMKMEHAITSTVGGVVREVVLSPGAGVREDQAILSVEPYDDDDQPSSEARPVDLDAIRDDLALVLDRRARTRDDRRPKAVERRHSAGRLTAREIIDRLCDRDSFFEYGSLVVAARQTTTDIEQLVNESPADGLITGIARINGAAFDDEASRAVVAVYDYTVYAGTQGQLSHDKADRIFTIAEKTRSPVVLWAEGGGGRGHDTDNYTHQPVTLQIFGRLSGLVPLVGVVGGRCFGGNAVLLGCCDVVIATKASAIGLGGPVMIEAAGLGEFTPEQVGPVTVQCRNGVVDLLAADDAEAVDLAKRYLTYFQGVTKEWDAEDQRLLRHVTPDSRLKSYDMRDLIRVLGDRGSFLELRAEFGRSMVVGLIRIEGIPFGVIANNPMVLSGAIDRDAADKASRFMQLCDAHGLPIISLCDTPGNMVGPEAESEGLLRHCSRPFVIGANLTVPVFAVLVRKAYGIGRNSMLGGSVRAPVFVVAWPGAEYGGMGLEGQVKMARKRELEAIGDPELRERTFQAMVDELYRMAGALRTATVLQIDEVIDPCETRAWIVAGIRAVGQSKYASGERRLYVDTW